MVIVIGHRMDLIALLYVTWLGIVFCGGRRLKMKLWPALKLFVLVLTLLQYVIVVGPPPIFCISKWANTMCITVVHYCKVIFSGPFVPTDPLYPLINWAFLPNPSLRTQSTRLLTDFLLLMCVCRQLLVFRMEQQAMQNNTPLPGGSNKSVLEDINQMNPIPAPQSHDYITFVQSWLDILKCILFSGSYWVSLAVMFLAGTNRVSIFSIGYLVGSFIFLWQGTEFFLRPIYTIIRWWKHLIRWNLLVITVKVLLQVPSCVLASELIELDWLRQLLGMGCLQPYVSEPKLLEWNLDAGLVWDSFCFAVLCFQLRIFQSYYFCHIVNESKANTVLASR